MSSEAIHGHLLQYCSRCGNPIFQGMRFCKNCGSPAIGVADPNTRAVSNPEAHELYIEAIKLSLAKGSGIPAIDVLQKAISSGLSPADEVDARMSLGDAYREIFGNSGLSAEEMIKTREFQVSMSEMEKALEVDRTNSVDNFSKPLEIGRLDKLDTMYRMVAGIKEEDEGTDAAISYLSRKLGLVEYQARPPLLGSLLKLAELYIKKGAIGSAVPFLYKVLGTKPLYPADEEWNSRLRRQAHEMLNETQGN